MTSPSWRGERDRVARRITSWEEGHGFRTWLNSKGIGGAELDELRTELEQLGNRITKAIRRVREVVEVANERLWPEYNRRLTLFDELIELRKAKRQRKAAQVEAAQSLEFTTIAMQRSLGVFGWADGGREWSACPRRLQTLIENYLSASGGGEGGPERGNRQERGGARSSRPPEAGPRPCSCTETQPWPKTGVSRYS